VVPVTTAAMAYWEFVLVFLLVPLVVLVALSLRLERFPRPYEVGIPLLTFVALAYTVPWESHLIRRGVWGYGSVLLGRVWAVPLEELAFVVLQVALAGVWLAQLGSPAGEDDGMTVGHRLAGVLAGSAVGLAGFVLLSRPSTLYLGAILAWAGPVLAIQWGFAWTVLVRHWRQVTLGVVVPTLYLSVADRYAIGAGIWYIAPEYSTGLTVGGLPVEEGLFFLATNVFLVQGLFLLAWVWERYALAATVETLSRTPEWLEGDRR